MVTNTKTTGNKAEAVILAEFVKRNIPVLMPFGDNEKYDLVIEINKKFLSVQVKTGRFINNCVVGELRHRTGFKRLTYETYYGKVDLLAVWCEELNQVYLLDILKFGNRHKAILRIHPPKNNSAISTIKWARDYEFSTTLDRLLTE